MLLVQWATDPPGDWAQSSLADWPNLPKKSEPTGSEVLDAAPGWIFALCYQGQIIRDFDHYAVLSRSGAGLRIVGWNDDPADYPDGEKFAIKYDFPLLTFDGQTFNTAYTITVYAEPMVYPKWNYPCDRRTLLEWSQFVPPNRPKDVRHGIWTTSQLAADLSAAQSRRGWADWIGVP